MYSTTTAYKNAITQPTRTWHLDIRITLQDSTVLTLTEADVALNSFKFQESSTCNDNLQIGSTYANSLDFSILNKAQKYNDYDFSDAIVNCRVGLETGISTNTPAIAGVAVAGRTIAGDTTATSAPVVEWVPLGIFNVVSCGRKTATIPLKTLDNMYRANKSASIVGIVFPINLYAMVTAFATSCSFTVSDKLKTELQALNLTLNEFTLSDYTCRDILGFIGALLGKNLRFNRSGELESFWYVETDAVVVPATRMLGASYDDYTVAVTGVVVTDVNNTEYVAGTDAYRMVFDLNPLVQSNTQAETLTSTLLLKLAALTYQPYKIKYVGDPSWQAGDLVTHTLNNGTSIVSPIMVHSFTFRGNSSLEAKGKTPEQTKQLSAAAKKVSGVATGVKKDLNAGLTGMQQTILNQTNLITNALGFYPHVEYDTTGQLRGYYMMSTPEDSDTTTVWAFTSNGIGVSHTGLAGPYTSSWTVDDSIVADVVTANMIRTGILQSRDNGKTFYLDLDNGILRMDASLIQINSVSVADTIAGTKADADSKYADLEGKQQSTDAQLANLESKTDATNSDLSNLADQTDQQLQSLQKELALKATPEGVTLAISEALKDGVTQVNTKTGYTFDINGMTIDKSDATTSTNINENGMIVSRKTGDTKEAVLTANDQGVDAINLTAHQYLVIGSKSRFEDYGDDRTACFWIG